MGTRGRRRRIAERWERDRAALPERPSPVLEPDGQRLPPFLPFLPPFLPFLPSFLPARGLARCSFRPAAPRCCPRTHPPFFLPLPASLMTSTEGEMMESIFMGMISIKCQLTWGLSHACTASRVNVHLISQRSALPRGNDPQGPGPKSRRPPPPLRPPRTPSGRPRLRAPGGCSLRALSGRGFGPAPGSAPAVIARICAASPARRGFGGSRRGERGRLGRGGSGQGWAGFFSCLRSGTCKLKPKVPPELMSVLACVCVCVCV